MTNIIQPLRPPFKGLQAHWFDQYGEDISNGIIKSSIGDKSRKPLNGMGYLFDGVDDYIDGGKFFPTENINNITICFWHKPELAKRTYNFSFNGANDNNRLSGHIPWSDGNIYWDFGDVYEGRISLAFNNDWYNKMAFWVFKATTGGIHSIWRNDVEILREVKNSKGFDNTNNYNLFIGSRNSNSDFMKGLLYDFRIYYEFLSDDDIRNLYNSKKIYSKTLLHYKCVDKGFIAFDSSGNDIHGKKIGTDVAGNNTFTYKGIDVVKNYQNEEGYSDNSKFELVKSNSDEYEGSWGNGLISDSFYQGVPTTAEIVNKSDGKWLKVTSEVLRIQPYFGNITTSFVRSGVFRVKAKIMLNIDINESFTITATANVPSNPFRYVNVATITQSDLDNNNEYYLDSTFAYAYDLATTSNNRTTYPVFLSFSISNNQNIGSYYEIANLSWIDTENYPVNDSDKNLDILNNKLTYKGEVSYPAELVESNCISFDGVDDYANVNKQIISSTPFTISGFFEYNADVGGAYPLFGRNGDTNNTFFLGW